MGLPESQTTPAAHCDLTILQQSMERVGRKLNDMVSEHERRKQENINEVTIEILGLDNTGNIGTGLEPMINTPQVDNNSVAVASGSRDTVINIPESQINEKLANTADLHILSESTKPTCPSLISSLGQPDFNSTEQNNGGENDATLTDDNISNLSSFYGFPSPPVPENGRVSFFYHVTLFFELILPYCWINTRLEIFIFV